jgi:pimeloyl-ACP methyl ester carboxylesterase
MFRFLAAAAATLVFTTPASARITPFATGFHVQMVQTNGTRLYDAIDNKVLLAKVGKLDMPVLALGAEKSLGAGEAEILRFVANNVTVGIVPNSGHWIMEENPQATIKLVTEFLAK